MKEAAKVVSIADATNGAKEQIELSEPWTARVQITGSADLLFHRWNNEAVAEKAAARKGSASKKTDNVESYVYRDAKGGLCLPGEYLRGAVVNAAKFRQDPRSPRKSAMDLVKAGVISLTPLAPLGVKDWDYEDARRVVIQRSAITRVRPAMRAGWKAQFDLMVNLPEYVDEIFLRELLGIAGRLIGVGDFRPTYGRFDLTRFERLK
ncbi:MAG TPA: hypothetical protein VGG49_13175 [Steroidobacteraceae bacterium]|jgi:hypothetical protein